MGKFVKRLSAPSSSDTHYYSSSNIFYACGYGMPNCTAYAWGRLYELTGKRYTKLCGNAENWWAAAKSAGLQTGSVPKLGAVVCWRAGVAGNSSDGAGHVAVVEEIKANGDIVTSNSAWKGTNFYLKTVTKASGYQYSTSRPFQGFIYCGVEFDDSITVQNTSQSKVESKISLKEGDVIQLKSGCTYYNGKNIPSWILQKTLYYRGTNSNGVNFSTLKTGSITGTVKKEDVLNYSSSNASTDKTIQVGNAVKISSNGVYYNGQSIPAWVKAKTWIVARIESNNKVIINISTDGKNAINSPVDIKYLTKV